MGSMQITPSVKLAARALLFNTEGWCAGQQIIKLALLPVDRAYPIIDRFIQYGWVECGLREGSPRFDRRFYYRVTKQGADGLRAIVEAGRES